MQMKSSVLVGLALRLATVAWPLATEVLALLWWAGYSSKSTLPTLVIVTAYLFLVFSPNRILFSHTGLIAVVLVISASMLLLLLYWSDPTGLPGMIWVHLGFAGAWLVTLTIERLMRTKLDT